MSVKITGPGRISAGWLGQRGACEPGLDEFRAAFPHGAEVTRGNLRAAAEKGLRLGWLVAVIADRQAYWEIMDRDALAANERTRFALDRREYREHNRAFRTSGERFSLAVSGRYDGLRLRLNLNKRRLRLLAEAIADALGLPPEGGSA